MKKIIYLVFFILKRGEKTPQTKQMFSWLTNLCFFFVFNERLKQPFKQQCLDDAPACCAHLHIYIYIYLIKLFCGYFGVWDIWQRGHSASHDPAATIIKDHIPTILNAPRLLLFLYCCYFFFFHFFSSRLVSCHRRHVPPLCSGTWFTPHYSPVNLPHWAAVTSGIFSLFK